MGRGGGIAMNGLPGCRPRRTRYQSKTRDGAPRNHIGGAAGRNAVVQTAFGRKLKYANRINRRRSGRILPDRLGRRPKRRNYCAARWAGIPKAAPAVKKTIFPAIADPVVWREKSGHTPPACQCRSSCRRLLANRFGANTVMHEENQQTEAKRSDKHRRQAGPAALKERAALNAGPFQCVAAAAIARYLEQPFKEDAQWRKYGQTAELFGQRLGHLSLQILQRWRRPVAAAPASGLKSEAVLRREKLFAAGAGELRHRD